MSEKWRDCRVRSSVLEGVPQLDQMEHFMSNWQRMVIARSEWEERRDQQHMVVWQGNFHSDRNDMSRTCGRRTSTYTLANTTQVSERDR